MILSSQSFKIIPHILDSTVRRYPKRVSLDGYAETTTSADTRVDAENEDQFFSNWDQSNSLAASPGTTLKSSSPPSLGMRPMISGATGPRVVTSASPVALPRLGKQGSRLGSSPGLAPANRPAKLGAKRASSAVNFEEAERMARAEEERIKLLGYDSKMEVQQDTPSNSSQSPSDIQQPPSTANTTIPSFNATSTTDNPQDIERLGLGFKRLGFGQSSASAPPTSTSAKHSTDDAPTTARERFGNQKAISSDMYFERNA